MARLKRWAGEVILLALACPVYAVRAVLAGVRKSRFLAAASRIEIRCECGKAVSLVGRWKCACGFTYNGHLLQVCPVCGSLPCMVRCYACGVTTKLPEP